MAASPSSSGKRRLYNERVWLGGERLGNAFLRNCSGCTVEISLYGAQVISWKNARGEELLFLSRKAIFEKNELIRGGIPICFPKSSDHEMVRDLHAFASKSMWIADSVSGSTPFHARVNNDEAFIDLILFGSPQITFPHKFEMRLNVRLSPAGKLIMTTRVSNLNPGGEPLPFTFTYHNYLSVSDIRDVRVEELQSMHYLDYLQNKQPCTEQDISITFKSEVDRLYLRTPKRVTVMDRNQKRSIIIEKNDELPDVVVWNPWDKKAKTITNFAKDEYNKMLCIGPARVETPIFLERCDEWTATQELTAKDL